LLLEVAEPPPSQRYGKVFAAPIDAARGLTFEAVFVPGHAEKMFPRKIVEEPILFASRSAGTSRRIRPGSKSERFATALAAGAAERRICFSYPRLDLDQGRPRVPSFYTLASC
jgi:ATP-dependent helicase/nuclease subunit B